MKKFAIAGLVVTLLAATLHAQDVPEPSATQAEHDWLQQLVGEWESQSEAIVDPNQPPLKCTGTERVRSVGGRWIIAENTNTVMDASVTGIMTVGYDPQKEKFVGTWVDSVTSYLWTYEGTLDAEGKVLTLEAEGPNPTAPGKLSKFKDVIELKSKDHKVLTSWMQGEDGKWVSFMTSNSRRTK